MRRLFLITLFFVSLFRLVGSAQTSPVPQTIPYSQNFDDLLHSSSVFPAGWQGWELAASVTSTFRINAPTGNRDLTANGSASSTSGAVYNYNGKVGFLMSGSLDPALVLALDASGKTNITVSYDAMTIRNPYGGTNTRINELTLQYRVGTSGSFTTLTGIEYQNNTVTQTGSGVTTPQNVQTKTITLPATCNNQPEVQIRWVNRDASGSGGRPSFAIDNIAVTAGEVASASLSVSPSSISFPATPVNSSATSTYSLAGTNLRANVSISATAPFSLSTDNVSFSQSLTVLSTDAGLASGKTIYVKYAPVTAGTQTGTITNSSEGVDDRSVNVTGTATGFISLMAPPYVQNFDAITSGLPVGVSVRIGATASALGNSATYTATPTNWNNISGAFKNFASGNNDEGVNQGIATDRALGVRQTGSFGDPGAAFVFQVTNTTGKINFTLDFNLQSLDAASPRETIWQVEYGFGLNPTQFFPANATGELTTGGNTFSNNPIHIDFGNALDNKSEIVTIRVVTRTETTGTGNRPSTAIDDFTLNWEDPNAETLSLSATSLNFDATAITNSRTSSYSMVGQTNLTAPIVITTAAPFALSTDNINFSSTLSVDPAEAANKTIYVQFAPSAAGVFSGTITHSSGSVTKTMSLTGEALDPSVLTFNFNSCTSTQVPGSGFLSVNVTGSQTWRCSSFGRNSTNGVDINGFANSTAQTNDAWLISPALNLNNMVNIPVLSFYSRGEFSGAKLQLYVSTTYSGSGAPTLADWTEITTANFPTPPGSATSVWTLSDNIDLSAYKSAAKLFIAFRYISSPALGAARWSVDDIAITDQPTLLTVTPNQLNFGEVTTGNQSASQAINLQALGGEGFSVVPPAGYEVSADNSSFTSAALPVSKEQAEAGLTLYVRFTPLQKQLKVDGSIKVIAEGLDKNVVSVTGSSYPKSQTFDVATYNLSFFGAGVNNNFTEQQLTTQVNNITTVVQRMNMDVIGVQEVSSDVAMDQLVTNLGNYAAVLSPRWSYSFDAPDPNFPPQKIGFIYNTNTMTLSTTEAPRAMFEGLYDSARLNLPGHRLLNYPTGSASSFWGSGRLPYMATFDASINGISKKVRVVVIHAKSGSTANDFNRRLYDVKVLKDSLDYWYGDDEVILLGDYNDRIIRSIYTGSSTSSYLPFVEDAANYTIVTQPLDVAGRTSFPSSNGLIDHLTISNELAPDYIPGSTDIEDPRAYISGYNATAGSDHLPVYSRFEFQPCAVGTPVAVSGPAIVCPESTELTYAIDPVATATTYQWTVPTGWVITAGEGSTQIKVTAGAAGGNISVVASNGCGASQPGSLPVSVTVTNGGTVTSSTPVVCYGAPVTVAVTGHSGTVEKWQSSTDGSNWTDLTATTTSYTAINLTSTTYFRVVMNNGCGAIESAAAEVIVNSPVISTVPDVYAVAKGAPNTLYLGYGPSSLTFKATVNGGTAPYSYKWTIGSNAGQGINTNMYTVSPQSTTTYYFNATDANGCDARPLWKTVTVVDVRCGPKLDKVTICQTIKGKSTTSCIAQKDVAAALGSGATLGACPVNAAATHMAQPVTEAGIANGLQFTASPNPTNGFFTIQVQSAHWQLPIQLRVTDLLGRTVEVRNNVVPNSNLQMGAAYTAGVYIVEIVQGTERRQLKLMKK